MLEKDLGVLDGAGRLEELDKVFVRSRVGQLRAREVSG